MWCAKEQSFAVGLHKKIRCTCHESIYFTLFFECVGTKDYVYQISISILLNFKKQTEK